jgi:hypothetical protein
LSAWPAALLLCGGLLLGGGSFVYPYLAARDQLMLWNFVLAIPLSVFMARRSMVFAQPRVAVRLVWLLPCVLAAAFAVELAAESWWPNSADEYDVTLLAQTLLHGRLWNPPPPAAPLFEPVWTFVRDGKWFAQYPPAWPALLAPFLAGGIGWLANPLLTTAMAAIMAGIFRTFDIPKPTAGALLILLLFSPFVLFNGASLFSHTMAADLVLGIVWLQARDDIRPGVANKLGIGCLFGIQLLTRYDVFVLTAVPFVLDRLWFRRLAFIRDAVPMALGGMPGICCYLAYNHAITGRPLRTPYAWVSAGAHIGLWRKHVALSDSVAQAALRTLHWTGEFFAFASPLILLLAAWAVAAKWRASSLRWFDVLLPGAVIFFFLYPNSAGHEFGPRYWFFAFPTAILTIATGLASGADGLRAGRRLLHAPRLAAAHVPLYAGVCIAFAAFNHRYTDARRQVLAASPPERPAVVLIPSRALWLTPWQTEPIIAASADFPRNGVDMTGDILLGRNDDAFARTSLYTALACTLTGRHIYRWRTPGVLDPVTCP